MDFKEFLFCAKKQAFYEEGRRFENGNEWLDEDYFSVRDGNGLIYTRTFNEDFFSMEILAEEGSAVWFMRSYPQFTTGESSISNGEFFKRDFYVFLRRVLGYMPENLPLRGPEKYDGGKWTYTNKVNGDVHYFQGIETVAFKDIEVYRMPYYGGLTKKTGEN